ncbi:MAG: hypothetical protein NXI32_30175 [bacterium]|nr:hypothetical protein [bacterium]
MVKLLIDHTRRENFSFNRLRRPLSVLYDYQFLEWLITSSLAAYRGSDAAEKQRLLTEEILRTIAEALPEENLYALSIASPLRRLLAIRRSADGSTKVRPDSPLAALGRS